MLTEADSKLVMTYAALLKLAVPSLVMSFVPMLVWLVLIVIDDAILDSSLPFYGVGLWLALGLTIASLVLFCYATLRVKFGTSGPRWRRILATDPSAPVPQRDAAHTDRAAAAIGTMAAGRLMSGSSNEAVSAAGSAAQVAGAVETVAVVADQVGSMAANVHEVADRFGIRVPSMRGVIVAMVALPLALLPAAYAPRISATIQRHQDEARAVAAAIAPIRSAYEAAFPLVFADDPAERTRDSYKVSAHADDELDSYVYVTLTFQGTVKEVSFHMDCPEDATPQEALNALDACVAELARPFAESGATADGWSPDAVTGVPTQLAAACLESVPTQKCHETLTQDGVRYSLSFYPKSDHDEPYFYLTVSSPR